MIVEFHYWNDLDRDYVLAFTWLDAREAPAKGDAVLEPDSTHMRLVVGREWVRADEVHVELGRDRYERRPS